MRRLSRSPVWLGAFLGISLLGAVLLLIVDANWLKGPIERTVSGKTGRTFEIQGNLDIPARWPPRVRLQRVRFANPGWAVEADTLRIGQAEITLAVLPLLRGRLVLPEVVLTEPV